MTRARALSVTGVAFAVTALLLPLVFLRFPLDLGVYLSGGHAALHGPGLYDDRVALEGYGFTYPPFAAVPFALLTLVPRGVAFGVMGVLTVGAALVLITQAWPGVLRELWLRPRPWHLVLLPLLACEPLRISLWFGQINVVLAALVLWDLRPGTSRYRGALIGVATAIKLTPGIFVLYLLVRRRYREAANAVGGFLAVTALAFALLPQDSVSYWTDKLFAVSRIGNTARNGNQSLLAMMQRLTSDDHTAHLLWAIASLVVLGAGLALARVLARSHGEVLAASVVGLTGLLVSPVSWTHHWVWCIPLVITLWQLQRARVGVVLVGLMFLGGCNKWPIDELFRWPVTRELAQNGYVVTALAVLVALLVLVRTERSSAAG